jgi:acetyl esterase/lipase
VITITGMGDRLRPEWPITITGIRSWVAVNASRYGIDPARISIMGNSAGGNLAMLAAYSMGNPLLPPSCDVPTVSVKRVVNLYGPADLSALYGSGGKLTDAPNPMTQYIGGSPTQYPDRYLEVSPLSYVRTKHRQP